MPGSSDTEMSADPRWAEPGRAAPDHRPGAPWWRHLAVILLLAGLTRVGFYFTGLVAMLILLTDLRRHPYTRLGGTLVIAWWTFLWSRNGVPPLIGFGLLAAAAAAFAVAAAQLRKLPVALARNAALGVTAAALGVLNLVPYGLADAKIDEPDALARAVAASRGDVRATHAQVVKTRERFDQRPVYLVLLFEPNSQTATTEDDEPCFRREEVHYVDGMSGAVDKTRLADRLVLAGARYQLAAARESDGNCLPLPRGTSRDIIRIPGR